MTAAADKSKKLSAAQARAWATKEVELLQARARVKKLEKECEELRDRYYDRLQPSPRTTGRTCASRPPAAGTCA
jgi:hypothetical protein